jgi:glycosyltransferase involved in cell wall biosynthesis
MISVIVPNANEERIHEVINELEDLLIDGEIIIAVDRDRRGKGWAVREALSYAKGDIIIFIDGDMDIHPKMIRRLLPHLEEFDIVVGKKDSRGLLSRYILTILSRLFIYTLFKIKVDTQTGLKIFRRYALPEWECNSWPFDIEILAKAKHAGFSMFEVTIEASSTKRMKLKSIVKTLVETLRIRKEVIIHESKRKESR